MSLLCCLPMFSSPDPEPRAWERFWAARCAKARRRVRRRVRVWVRMGLGENVFGGRACSSISYILIQRHFQVSLISASAMGGRGVLLVPRPKRISRGWGDVPTGIVAKHIVEYCC